MAQQFSNDQYADEGSQFSAPQGDASNFQGAQQFSGFPAYGAFPGAAFPGAYPGAQFAGAYPTAFPGAQFGQPTVLPGQYGGFEAPAYGATVLPAGGYAAAPVYGSTFVAHQTAIPIPVRQPGYNERYVAWKNRQKAFNRYKQATKEAIKNSRNIPTNTYALAPATTYVQQPTYFGAAPQPTYLPQQVPATYFGAQQGLDYAQYAPQATYFGAQPYGVQYGAPLAFPAGATSFGQDFNSYSETSQAQNVDVPSQQEEPEIRGTQV